LEKKVCKIVRGVISPLLANIYLHYVSDLWAHQWRGRHATGRVMLVRYADDSVSGFERQADGKVFLAALRERLAEFGLALHPEKTRLIEFGRYAVCKPAPAWQREAGDIRLSGLYALLWNHPTGRVQDTATDH